MKWAAWALSALLVSLPLPLAAQTGGSTEEPSAVETTKGQKVVRAEVLAAFTRLVGKGELRTRFGLPDTAFWRRSGGMTLALFAENVAELRPELESVAAPFAEVSGLDISVLETGAAVAPEKNLAELAPEAHLVFVVGSRIYLAEIAKASNFDKGMMARFEMGTWPFMFSFAQNQERRGVVLLADDEPQRAHEAAFILATVWGLGGVTLGPELTGLVGDSGAGPMLTPLGEAVFRLFFHDDLEVGMPLADAVRRAETLLPQPSRQ